MVCLILVFLVVGPGYFRLEQISNRTSEVSDRTGQTVRQEEATQYCLRQIVDILVVRSAAINEAAKFRSDILDEVLRSAASGDIATLRENLQKYVQASDYYKGVLKDNPVPDRPNLTCPS